MNLARLFRQVWTLAAAARLDWQESNPLMMKHRILLSQIACIGSLIDVFNSFNVANYAKLRHVFGCNCSIAKVVEQEQVLCLCVCVGVVRAVNLPTHVSHRTHRQACQPAALLRLTQ